MIRGDQFEPRGPDLDIDPAAFLHPTALLYGKVRLAAGVSVWPYAVIRAENDQVTIGEGTNIQDFVMIHIGTGVGTTVGRDCSITHRVTLHGCTIEDDVLVGIGATIMDGSVVGAGSIVAGGAFLKEGTIVPPHSIVAGVPAVVKATRDSSAANRFNAWLYLENAHAYAEGDHRAWNRVDLVAEAQRRGLAR